MSVNAQNDWENSTIFGINKEPAHAAFVPLSTNGKLADFSKESSPFVQMLNGTWKFHWVKKPADRPVDFYKPSYDVSSWDELWLLDKHYSYSFMMSPVTDNK